MAVTPTSQMSQIMQDVAKSQLAQKGLDAEKRLEANKSQGPSAISSADLMSSFQGYQASHPGSDLAEFAVATAPKLDVSAQKIGQMIASMQSGSDPLSTGPANASLDQISQIDGLEAQKRLEANKGSSTPDSSDLMASYAGYQVSHPNATLADFAAETAPKIGVTKYDIINTIDSINDAANNAAAQKIGS